MRPATPWLPTGSGTPWPATPWLPTGPALDGPAVRPVRQETERAAGADGGRDCARAVQ